MENDETLRALGRIKREADSYSVPLVVTAERRETIRFLFWIVGGFVSLIVTIVTATAFVISYKTDITQNKTDIALLRAENAAMKAESAVSLATAKRVEEEQQRRIPQLETALKKIAALDAYDFKKLNDLVMDLASQRDYGISNKEWYLSKHGRVPPSNPAAQP